MPAKHRRYRPRQIPVCNDSGEDIPAWSVARISGVTDGVATIAKPDADNMPICYLVVTGRAVIPDGATSAATPAEVGKIWAKYAGTAPSAGDERGTADGSFELTAGNLGFSVLGVNTTQGIALVAPKAIMASPYWQDDP